MHMLLNTISPGSDLFQGDIKPCKDDDEAGLIMS